MHLPTPLALARSVERAVGHRNQPTNSRLNRLITIDGVAGV